MTSPVPSPAGRVDDGDDGLTRVGGAVRRRHERVVRGIGDDSMDTVRGQRRQLILCVNPSIFGVLLLGSCVQGYVTEAGQFARLVHRSAQLGELVAKAAVVPRRRRERPLL